MIIRSHLFDSVWSSDSVEVLGLNYTMDMDHLDHFQPCFVSLLNRKLDLYLFAFESCLAYNLYFMVICFLLKYLFSSKSNT